MDSEDFESCFNLFRLPSVWLKYFAFSKLVPASLFGEDSDRLAYPAIAVVPMGFTASVGIIQHIVRRLVLDSCALHVSELHRHQNTPCLRSGVADIYLGSFDWIRSLPKVCSRMRKSEESKEHSLFVESCKEIGLPLNQAKHIVGAVTANIQGGLLDGEIGSLELGPDKATTLCWASVGRECGC